jgi:hypothetical protein
MTVALSKQQSSEYLHLLVSIVYFRPLPAVNTPTVISSMANAHALRDMEEMIAWRQVQPRDRGSHETRILTDL